MELKTDIFSAVYSEESNTIVMQGCIRTGDPVFFKKLDDLFEDVQKNNKLSLIFDLRELSDINSTGLGVLYHFAASKNDIKDYSLRIKANSSVYWQERYLPNIKKFLPGVQLEFFRG